MSQQQEFTEIRKRILTTGIRVGTPVKTKFMKPFITKPDPDGLYMLDLTITLDRIGIAARFINRVGIENMIVCSGRINATTPIEKFCEVTGATSKLGRFMPGTLTNPSLPYYIEPKLVVITDPAVDGQTITEATNAGIPIIGMSDTDNITSKIDLVIPANNRGRKALAAAYWLLAQEILMDRGDLKAGESIKYDIDDFETKSTEEAIE